MKLVEITPWLNRMPQPPPDGPPCPMDAEHGKTERTVTHPPTYYCPMCHRCWRDEGSAPENAPKKP